MNKIRFAKVKENALIPSKREEDAGYDIYACFDEDYIIIQPHETKLIPTGIASTFSDDYVMVLKERGSTGTKGMAQRSGIIDSGFRNEWLVPITNANYKPIIITDILSYTKITVVDEECGIRYFSNDNSIIYPKSKAIAQALLLPVPKVEIEEITYDELIEIKSERGNGMLGSSGK